ncbi:MAG: hypothetical protein K1X72_00320 [Pyrinomonadaceae bacterium]|nr:hypothetical protein [Pyrinomonadaceae bacterium]
MTFLNYVFSLNLEKYEGVRPINIYLLRILYFLMLAVMSVDAWKMIFTNDGQLEKFRAMAICVWAAYGTLGLFGLFKPLKWLPIVLFMIFYKTLWLIVVSLPLWRANQLEGSSAEEMTYIFIAAPFMLLVIPWKYVFKNYLFWSE